VPLQPEDTKRGLSARERRIVDGLIAGEHPTVTAEHVERVLDVPRLAANQILARLARKGWLLRIRRGLYSPVPLGAATTRAGIEDPWLLAMALYSPGYVSGWSAAEHWDLTEQIFNAVCVVTAVPQRAVSQRHAGVAFYVRSVAPDAIFGVKQIWLGSSKAHVADPTRLVVDVLQAPDLGGGIRHTLDIVRAYWRSTHADPTRALDYAERLGVGTVFKRLGYTADRYAKPTAEWVARCRRGMSAGVSRLDPRGPSRGRILTRWRRRVNTPEGDA
jgi:predicted transcriptional regulator of viral defense system